jgi:universal stress protein A
MKLEHILVPVDFSNYGEVAFAHVEELLKKFPARVTLLHAVEPSFTQAIELSELNAQLNEELTASAEERIKALATSLRPRFHAKAVWIIGAPWVAICDWAASHQVDLIVMPTHGYSGLKHVLMGSVAEKVVQKAPCPVMIARPARTAKSAQE